MDDFVSDMEIEVTFREFHKTHDAARMAENSVKDARLEEFPTEFLVQLLATLKAGQRLTDAETGPDSHYAHSYNDNICRVMEELKTRPKIVDTRP